MEQKLHKNDNITTFTIFNNDCSVEFAEEIVDFLIKIPRLCDAFKRRLFVQPDPKDIFILALTELRDTGDIDCLIRSLNWQQNTINSLLCDVDALNRSLIQTDRLRQEVARLRHNIGVVRNRNSELLSALKSNGCTIPKRKENEIKKKNQSTSR